MARLRYNGLTATLGASLTNSDTTITFAAPLTHSGGTAVPTISGGDYIPLTILTSAGAVSEIVSLTAYTSGATTGTITRAQESTTGVAHSSGDAVVHSATVADFASSGGGSALLASATYNPGTETSLSTASTSAVDANAALSATFTAPTNGSVLVTLAAVGAVSADGAAMYWNLRSGSSDVAGTSRQVTGSATNDMKVVIILVTGLTPGNSYTYKWGYRIHNSSFNALIHTGGVFGPAMMLVQSTA